MNKSSTPKRILIAFIVIYLILGVFIVPEYGISIDHSQETDRAEIAMRSYSLNDPEGQIEDYLSLGVNQYYGTFQMSLFLLVENSLRPLLNTPEYHILHYMFFVTFVAGIYGIYILTRRWVSDWAALTAALLFGLQPLFFGHSFINPKDIPSMTIFILTIAAGLRFSDKLNGFSIPESPLTLAQIWQRTREKWAAGSKNQRRWLRCLFWLAVILLTLQITRLPELVIAPLIEAAYNAPETSWLGQMFSQYAPHSATIPAADYTKHAIVLFWRGLNAVWVAVVVLAIGVYFWQDVQTYLTKDAFRDFWRSAVSRHLQEYRQKNRSYWLAALLAGVVWGMAISTRATNITAGGIVGLYILLKYRERSILPLAVYTTSALVACYATWPYLWYFGLQGFLDGMTVFADYPWIGGRVWLRGIVAIEDLPATYIPHTMAIQFTEPLVGLSLLGIFLSIVWAVQRKFPRLDLFILLSWFFLPLVYIALAHPTLYNNFRQFFFITPPLFVFSAVVIDWVRTRIKSSLVLLLLMLAVIAPGALEIVRLHPYQYVYYNQFVGGTSGAAGLYELDYWTISYREIMEYINEHTPQNGHVMIRDGNDVPAYYAREDIDLDHMRLDTTPEELAMYDYVITTTNHRHELVYLEMDEYPIVFSVYAGDTLLAMVRKP